MPQKKKKKNKIEHNIENYIKVYEDVIDGDLCDEIIKEYENSEEWENSSTRDDVVGSVERNYEIITISSSNSIIKNIVKRKKNDELIYDLISNIKDLYCKEFKYLDIIFDTGFDLIRYGKGQFYKEHVDNFKNGKMSIACSIHLNDNYEGGELTFFNNKKVLKCKKGSIIVFPSNFMYPHQIMSVSDGNRYSIETWLV